MVYNFLMRTLTAEIAKQIGKKATLSGWVHKIRKLGGITFVVIRDRSGLAQAVVEKKEANKLLEDLSTESVITLTGTVAKEERAPQGAELRVEKVEVLSAVKEELPIEINKKDLNVNLDTLLDWRQLTLRAPKQKSIFNVSAEITQAFRDYLNENAFTEIVSPKIVEEGLETGGAEMFEVKYFKKKAFLSQSPQMYKQIMVGVFERVFETGTFYRAEKHNTSRHLNEIFMMDFEMGFISSWTEIMDMAEGYIKFLVKKLAANCQSEIKEFGQELPKIGKTIPRMKLTEAQEILEKEYGMKCIGEPDLDPEGERAICEYAFKKFASDFIFITHYPSKKRPFYTMDDPENPKETLSFDLLFRGVEITSGGQRLHRYEDYVNKLKARGQNPADFESYLSAFKFGMPPHGGTGWGQARILEKVLGISNVREVTLFPRDINRLRP